MEPHSRLRYTPLGFGAASLVGEDAAAVAAAVAVFVVGVTRAGTVSVSVLAVTVFCFLCFFASGCWLFIGTTDLSEASSVATAGNLATHPQTNINRAHARGVCNW